MGNFNGHITEDRPGMEDILYEFIMSKPNEFPFLMDQDNAIKLRKIFDITYYDLLSGDKYYNATCEIDFMDGWADLTVCIYEKELEMIERKHKIQKLCQTIGIKK